MAGNGQIWQPWFLSILLCSLVSIMLIGQQYSITNPRGLWRTHVFILRLNCTRVYSPYLVTSDLSHFFLSKKKNKLKYSHFITMHCFSYITKKPNTTSQHMGLFKKFKIYNYLCKAVKRSLHPHYNDSHLLSMTCASKTLEIFPNQIQTENASSL